MLHYEGPSYPHDRAVTDKLEQKLTRMGHTVYRLALPEKPPDRGGARNYSWRKIEHVHDFHICVSNTARDNAGAKKPARVEIGNLEHAHLLMVSPPFKKGAKKANINDGSFIEFVASILQQIAGGK